MQLPINTKSAYTGIMLSFALILSYLESLVSFDMLFPGIKLGLSNFIVLIALYVFGPIFAFALCISKAVLSSLLFGSMAAMIYSLCGAVLSFAIMFVLYRCGDLHIPVISAAGGVFHNLGQFIAAVYIMKTFVPGFWALYLSVLIISGLTTGLITGFIAQLACPYIKKIISKGDRI